MAKKRTQVVSSIWLIFAGFSGIQTVYADSLAEMQSRLNQEVIAKPFSVASEAELNSALNAATERGKPTRVNPVSGYGYGNFGNYYQPYYGFGAGYGFGYYSPFYNNYRPFYAGYW
jgi:hypothetical protein